MSSRGERGVGLGPVSDEFEAEGAWIRYDPLDLSPMAAVKLLFVMDEAAVGSEVEQPATHRTGERSPSASSSPRPRAS